jgi:nicotinate-nucleotide pyrophosphorylase (carboxylating)
MSKEFQQLDWDAAVEDDLRQLIRLAVREDLSRQYDWTTVALVEPDQQGRAAVVVRQDGVLAGLRAIPVVIDEMQATLDCQLRFTDGDEVPAGTVVAELSGSARDLLTCERPILNFLGRLSGIATGTRQYVRRIEGTRARIYDTRKTTPGWRRLEKYAVRCGGGWNHRIGLFDAILIKDNHLALSSEKNLSPADAVRRARGFVSQMTPDLFPGIDVSRMIIEVEIDRLELLDDVLAAGPDIVLLDNMPAATCGRGPTRCRRTAYRIGGIRRRFTGLGTRDCPVRRRTHQRGWTHPFGQSAGRGIGLGAVALTRICRCDVDCFEPATSPIS